MSATSTDRAHASVPWSKTLLVGIDTLNSINMSDMYRICRRKYHETDDL